MREHFEGHIFSASCLTVRELMAISPFIRTYGILNKIPGNESVSFVRMLVGIVPLLCEEDRWELSADHYAVSSGCQRF